MSSGWVMRALRWSAICALIALALMVWGILAPSPISLVIAMSVGQGLGTASFAVFGLVVFLDLKRAHIFSKRPTRLSSRPPDEPPSQRP